MKFKFDPNQDFQLDALEATADLFDGQPRVLGGMRFQQGARGPLPIAAVEWLRGPDAGRSVLVLERHASGSDDGS